MITCPHCQGPADRFRLAGLDWLDCPRCQLQGAAPPVRVEAGQAEPVGGPPAAVPARAGATPDGFAGW